MFQPAFKCCNHLKAGQNTQHLPRICNWGQILKLDFMMQVYGGDIDFPGFILYLVLKFGIRVSL